MVHSHAAALAATRQEELTRLIQERLASVGEKQAAVVL